MPASFWDAATRDSICRRVERLTPDAVAQWGKFTATEMLAHLNDSFLMATGDLPVASKKLPLRYFPLKQLVIYVLPFPKGAPTAPEIIKRGATARFEEERTAFRTYADRLAAKPVTDTWPEHPAFGPLTHRAWGVLEFRHIDHHLRQFGV